MRWQQPFLRYFWISIPLVKFIMHIPINEISWKITLDKRICIWSVLHLFEETLLLRLFPLTFPFVTYSRDSKLNTLTTIYSFSDYPTFLAKAQGLIYNLGPHPYMDHFKKENNINKKHKKLKNYIFVKYRVMEITFWSCLIFRKNKVYTIKFRK